MWERNTSSFTFYHFLIIKSAWKSPKVTAKVGGVLRAPSEE